MTMSTESRTLYEAARAGRSDAVRRVLLDGHVPADQVHVTPEGDLTTPLYAACANGHVNVVRELVNHEADPYRPCTRRPRTPLFIAFVNGHTNVVAELVWRPLVYASLFGRLDRVRELVDVRRVSLTHNSRASRFAVYAAAERGHLEVVRYLLDRGAPADVGRSSDSSMTPLLVASFNGHLDVARLLLDRGAAADQVCESWSPMCAASQNGHTDIVQLLLDRGAVVDHARFSELAVAARYGHSGVVRLLLAAGASTVRTLGTEAQTPLVAAAARGHAGIVVQLLAAPPDAADVRRALDLAHKGGHVDAVVVLTAHDRPWLFSPPAATSPDTGSVVISMLEELAQYRAMHRGLQDLIVRAVTLARQA